MIIKKCSEYYHQEFVEIITTNKFGYPLYRRKIMEGQSEKEN